MAESTASEASFIKHCITYGGGSVGKANKALPAIRRAVVRLRRRADKGKDFLLFQCEHQNPFVQLSASSYLLPLNENIARVHLASLRKKYSGHPDLPLRTVSIYAGGVLNEWDAGNLRDYLLAEST